MLTIDKELKALIPALSEDEYKALSDSIADEGIRDAIIATMDGVIVDGHNRYEIAKGQGFSEDAIPVERRYFDDRESIMLWMIDNQRGRRNLSKQAWLDLGFKRAELLKPKANANKGGWKGNQYAKPDEAESQESDKQPTETVDTLQEAADYAGVSRDTAAKYKRVMADAPDEIKEKVRTGEMKINRAYQETKKEEVSKENHQEVDRQRSKKEIENEGHRMALKVIDKITKILEGAEPTVRAVVLKHIDDWLEENNG